MVQFENNSIYLYITLFFLPNHLQHLLTVLPDKIFFCERSLFSNIFLHGGDAESIAFPELNLKRINNYTLLTLISQNLFELTPLKSR